jgi:hypothetical protein
MPPPIISYDKKLTLKGASYNVSFVQSIECTFRQIIDACHGICYVSEDTKTFWHRGIIKGIEDRFNPQHATIGEDKASRHKHHEKQ